MLCRGIIFNLTGPLHVCYSFLFFLWDPLCANICVSVHFLCFFFEPSSYFVSLSYSTLLIFYFIIYVYLIVF